MAKHWFYQKWQPKQFLISLLAISKSAAWPIVFKKIIPFIVL